MGFHWPWSSYSTLNAWWNGRRDGKIPVPPSEQEEHAPYELELQKLAEENIRRVAQRWEQMDRKLKSEYCKARFQRESAQKGFNAASVDHQEAEEDADTARQLIKEIYGKEHLSPWGYRMLMILLGIVEFPINSVVFDLFGEAKAFTYLMASGIALVIPLSAHYAGVFLKSEPFRKGGSNTERTLLVLSILAPCLVLGFIAYFREKFFEAAGVHKILGIEMDPVLVMITFLGINLLIFFVGLLISYFHHDPQVQRLRKELKVAMKNLEGESEDLAHFEALRRTTEHRYHEIRHLRQNEWEHKRHEALEIKSIVERLIQHYRKHNLRARKDGKLPRSFKTLPAIELPEALQEIEWDCAELLEELPRPSQNTWAHLERQDASSREKEHVKR